MPYKKDEAKKAKIRSSKPVSIDEDQMQKHKSKGVFRAEEYEVE